MRSLPILLLFVATLATVVPARAQTQVPPTPPPVPQSVADYAADYTDRVGGNAVLFSGRNQSPLRGNIMESMYLRDRGQAEYDASGFKITPRPVTVTESYAVGDIFYDGVLYPGVSMRLDLHRDQLAVARPAGTSMPGVVIDPDRLGWADLRGYRILYLPPPVAPGDLPSGYYLQLNHGRHRILMKERFELDSNRLNFSNHIVRYYVEKDGVFHRVVGSGSVLRLLREHRGELKRFIRTRGISVRHDMDRALVEIVGEYERLNYR